MMWLLSPSPQLLLWLPPRPPSHYRLLHTPLPLPPSRSTLTPPSLIKTKVLVVYFRKQRTSLYFLRRLRSFKIRRTVLQMFYLSGVASDIFCALVCWGSRVKAADASRLNKHIRKAGSFLGFFGRGVGEEDFENTSVLWTVPLIPCEPYWSHLIAPSAIDWHHRGAPQKSQEVIPTSGHQFV